MSLSSAWPSPSSIGFPKASDRLLDSSASRDNSSRVLKIVILCGGKGTRLREETEFRPKPMVPIGDRPILWHVMKIYATHGHKDFVLCLGYKGEMIKEYFRNYLWMTSDVTLKLGSEPEIKFRDHHDEEDWSVTLAGTGENTLTAGRIQRIKRYLGKDDYFLFTYGDGVGDVDINAVIKFHREHGKLLTLTAVRPAGRFGELQLDLSGTITQFDEKPQGGWISGGFFVGSRGVFDYLPKDSDAKMFEQEPMQRLAADGQLAAYKHEGFWQPMDTFQEFTLLNRLWSENKAPWKIW
jgi:glucose-1-phosphate cytidylyltransferase